LELLVCPSDNTVQQVQAGCSYVANCGQADVNPSGSTYIPPDWAANGIFMSRWEYDTSKSAVRSPADYQRNSLDTIPDGSSNTFLLSESLDAKQWYDEVSYPNITNNGYQTAPINGATLTPASSSSGSSAPTTATPEIYTGFVWWDTPSSVAQNINGLSITD